MQMTSPSIPARQIQAVRQIFVRKTQGSLQMTEYSSIPSGNLIAAADVKGTNVYDLAGEEIGSVDDVMIDKITGRAVYVVMSFGGFLSTGENYRSLISLPWPILKYDARKSGYVVNLNKRVLEDGSGGARHSGHNWISDCGFSGPWLHQNAIGGLKDSIKK
jgi:sporulation protein YlmC with PRC-barrel domain